jgi:hypothetical protein
VLGILVFQLATRIEADFSTYEDPHSFSVGIRNVLVNGPPALRDRAMAELPEGAAGSAAVAGDGYQVSLIRNPPLADSVAHTDQPSGKLLDLLQLEPATTYCCRKQRLSFAGDQGIDDEAELVDQAGVEQAGRDSGAAHQIDVLARLPFEGGVVVDAPEEARVRPTS